MPMIDVTAAEGTFSPANEAVLLQRLTTSLLTWEKASDVPLVVANTGAYLRVVPRARVTAGGVPADVVRVEILTPAGTLTQGQRQGITADAVRIAAELGENVHAQRVWVLFREAVDGGWGLAGRALTSAEISAAVQHARS